MVHVVHHVLQHLIHARRLHLGQRTNLAEAVGDELQPFHVLVHLRYQFVVGILFFQDFHPSHEAGDGRAELVGRLLTQSHPYLVLLSSLRREQGKDGDDNEYQYHTKLHKGVVGQPLEYAAVVEAHIVIVGMRTVVEIDADVLATGQHTSAHLGGGLQTVLIVFSFQMYIAEGLCVAFRVQYDDGDGIVLVDYFQHQCQVGVLVGGVERLHGCGPYFHACPFLPLQVASEEV